MPHLTISRTIIAVAIFLILTANGAFFSNIVEIYPVTLNNLPFLLSLALLFCCATILLLSLVCFRYTIKAIAITTLLISSSAAYFMDTYNIVIDDSMIDNIMKTDMAETMDLLSLKLLIYVALIGIVPALLIYKAPIQVGTFKRELIARIQLFGITAIIAAATILAFGSNYATFFREHKQLRFYSNPAYYIYSSGKYFGTTFTSGTTPLQPIGTDAVRNSRSDKQKLVIFVVGETARSNRFSLNGYERNTNPQLQQFPLVSYDNVWSCGTSTAISVPCMFAIYGRDDFSVSKADTTENVLDILQRAGVATLWLDNNSSSKGVADRIPYLSYKSPELNPHCEEECRDTGMLPNLQSYIDSNTNNDMFIVLHQMGNHGPAYYKRYPQEFKQFTPTCDTNALESCSNEIIGNTYDNAILYTDHFLAETIRLLQRNEAQFATAMIYVSDHGESLGENGLYLHGLPYLFAPDVQKQVPMIAWFDSDFQTLGIDLQQLQQDRSNEYSHDNLFHTILGLMDITTSVYNPQLDMWRN